MARAKKNDAVPGRLRTPLGRVLGPFFVGGAASHLGGLALCGSGSASGFKVAPVPGECNPSESNSPHVPKKRTLRRRAPLLLAPIAGFRDPPDEVSLARAFVRKRLWVLPQWSYGQSRGLSAFTRARPHGR